MANKEQRTLREIHQYIADFDAKIARQHTIVNNAGRSIIKEFSPAENAQPEDIINGIYNIGQRRALLIERLEQNSLPYLERKKAEVAREEDVAVSEAIKAYEGIRTLSRLGVYSQAEQELLEKGISELPEEIAIRIRTAPIENKETQKQGFLGRLFRRQQERKIDTSPNTVVVGQEQQHKPVVRREIAKPLTSVLHPELHSEIVVEQVKTTLAPPATAEVEIQDAKEETKKFPDGKFLGKEGTLPHKIYEALIDFSNSGDLTASKDLEDKIFGEEIKAGIITQDQAHIKIRDGLTQLRSKLNGTGLNIANKGTVKYPFYKLEITGEIPDSVWNPNQKQRATTEKPSKDIQLRSENTQTFIVDGKETSFPSLDVIGKEGSIVRKYYEFLLAKKTDGVTTTIKEESDYIYGEHSDKAVARTYTMRQQINLKLEPYGIRIGAEKRAPRNKNEEPIPQYSTEEITPSGVESSNRIETLTDEAAPVVKQPDQTQDTGKIRLAWGERKTLQMLQGTSEDNPMTTEEIAQRLYPGKKVNREDMAKLQTYIAGLRSFSLPGTGIEIFHPLTKDGNPIPNRHYVKLPEGKTLEELVDFESGPSSPKPSTQSVERIAVSIGGQNLQEEIVTDVHPPLIPEQQEVILPHFVIYEAGMETEFEGRRSRFNFRDQWEVFKRIAKRPNQELTAYELAGLDPQTKNTKALEDAENYFRNLISRFEENPKKPKIFIVTESNYNPRFEFRATVEFKPDTSRNTNNYIPQGQ